MVQIIHDESKRMSRLVTDLLDFARMESGHMRLYKDEFIADSIFWKEWLINSCKLREMQKLNLSLDITKNRRSISNADEDRLEQVFTNLIDNAIRHTPDGGEVTLGMSKEMECLK